MKREKTLLETAIEYNPKHSLVVTRQHAQLAVAWLIGDVTFSQVKAALKQRSGNTYAILARSLMAAYKLKMIK